ncbi:MAG TPA: TIGR03085 family metal-binding protein [Microthrixaceae bacterium]|nr:TIGR03085 family protein [Microthrixaceae bacterium]HNI34132.1 TIGR03085 family metal-binding protein [Microthrixaceae bacterium]
MSDDLDLRERHGLCNLMLGLGPDAPTLCGDWTAFDLAAHLSVRERNPLSAPGILFGGPFEGFTEALMAREQKRGFEAVVARVRNPPPGPLSIPAVRSAMSLIEFTVHHEDLRRPNGLGPRNDIDDLNEAIWQKIKQLSGLILRRARIGDISLQLHATGAVDSSHRVGKGSRVVEIRGPAVELLLYLYGRQASAEVETIGEDDDVATAADANFGI